MAPSVEQEKNTVNGDLVAEHPDEQYTSTETNSSENNSDVQPDEDSVNKLRNLPLNDSPPNVNDNLNHDLTGPFQRSYLNSFYEMNNLQRNVFGVPNGEHRPADSSMTGKEKLEFDGLYPCPKCDFVGRNDDELHEHAHRHDPYECGTCGFLADTPSNLQTHLKDEHLEIPVSKWDDNILFHEPQTPLHPPEPLVKSSSKKKTTKVKPFEENIDKPRKTSCKICNKFTGNTKMEYYAHLREVHSKNVKLLHCDLCPFIALYKHHLQFHFRNHCGSKPYKCNRCDYSCINRSMLNSHYKSHSDIYQYSCKNCSYMTKYLHSLKMHLRKYSHQPGRVLNPDGSVNSNTIIDVHGKRRGPKSKKRKSEIDQMQEGRESSKSKSSPSPPSPSFSQHPSQNIRILYNPQIYNNYTGNLYVRPGPTEATNYLLHSPPSIGGTTFRCAYCEFVTGSFDIYHYHTCSHAAQDRLSDGSFNPKYPEFLQRPYNFGSLSVGPSFNSESFSGNIVNQSTAVERRNINESRRMDVTNNAIHFQNSANRMNNYETMDNNHGDKRASASGMAIDPEALTFNGQQYPKQRYRRHKENRNEKWLKSNTPSPSETITVKEEIPEPMNGIRSPSTNNPPDNGPLDLSIKPSISSETKSNEISSDYRLPGGSIRATMNRASSDSSKFGKESKVSTRKTNRRKGKAFKLNQYMIENDPVSDGAETELEKMRSLYESTFPNEARSKPVFGIEIKKSVPRINFKPTLNTTNWNEHNSIEPTQADFSQYIPLPKLEHTFIEPNYADMQKDRQRARHISNASWCPHCDVDSGSPELHDYHSSYHSKNDPFTCAKCGLRCNDKITFNSHILLGSRINGNCINTIEECKS
ncbi:unnamed protein product [Larinioides sclopetarius]|uniref:Protein hunchback n=1 Tax=Larinioides sclopetarius TaxID=280406 RepID=A0AAV2ASY8_9ARAC